MKDRIEIERNHFITRDRCLYWEETGTLILADVHLGKVEHFRRSGIAVPPETGTLEFDRLDVLINEFKPQRILILGDLFHSYRNSATDHFIQWVKSHSGIKFHLVKGNHDKYTTEDLGIEVTETLEEDVFIFSHEKIEHPLFFNFHGHVHPAVKLRGKGASSLKLSCLWVSKNHAVLPAFSRFTGNHVVKPSKSDTIVLFD